MGLFLADDVEQLPGAVGEDDAVDLGVVLDGDEQAVERLVGRDGGDRGEGALGLVHVLAAHGVAEGLARVVPGREHARLDRVQHFRGAAAVFLDAVRVAVEDLEHGQGAAVFGQLARHVIGGGERHQGVEADVVLAAERPRVGQRRGGHELLQLGPGAELLDEDRDEVPDGRLLHQADERFEPSEGESLAAAVIVGPGGREAHVERRAEADARDQHAPADVPEETPTRALRAHRRRPFRCSLRSARRQAWWTGPSGALESDP